MLKVSFVMASLISLWTSRIEQILHNFEDQKIANFLYLEQVDFRVTLVIYLRGLSGLTLPGGYFLVF